MAIKVVNWNSTERLSCACCTPAEVQLQIGISDIVSATLTNVTKLRTGAKCSCHCGQCGTCVYQYSFAYDTADLPGEATSISSSDISGVLCSGALTSWVNNRIAESLAAAIQPTSVNYSSDRDTWDFKATAAEDIHEVTFDITNPSALVDLAGMAGYSLEVNISNNGAYQTGVTAAMYQDNVLLVGSQRGLEQQEDAGSTVVRQVGKAAQIEITPIPPGGTSTFKVTLASKNFVPVTGSSVAITQVWFDGELSA